MTTTFSREVLIEVEPTPKASVRQRRSISTKDHSLKKMSLANPLLQLRTNATVLALKP
jgi:hypothetical protein